MSCKNGEDCKEPRKRLRALLALGAMLVIFIVLSALSFIGARDQVTPNQVQYAGFSANSGKRVFQAYNCMDCHTLVGNGAYFAPDLTKEYKQTGPAWLAAFLPSAGGWPTEAAVKVQLANPVVAKAAGVDNIEDYYQKFPGAKQRVQRRGGGETYMPNLPFRTHEADKLIAYLRYTSDMNTEGWPPKIKIKGGLAKRLRLAGIASVKKTHESAVATHEQPQKSADKSNGKSASNPVQTGKTIADDYACTSCHSTGSDRKVGPGWGGLYGSSVTLADGSQITADTAYLTESIKNPDAKIVKGYPQGVMPDYGDQLDDTQVTALVAYLKSLEDK